MAGLSGGRLPPAGSRLDDHRPLIGRHGELATARELLIDGRVRLLTLTGSPGVGKTTLGLAILAEIDDCLFVDLATVVDPGQVLATIADEVGARTPANVPPLERLAAFLAGRQTVLLLDNFEHVLAAAPDVGALLDAYPDLRVIVTSRAPLHLRFEHELPVPPLAVPDPSASAPIETIARAPAVELFVQRAQTTLPSFALTERNARAVAEICTRLDGLPLAIELAAARARLLPPEAIARRLRASDHQAADLQRPPPGSSAASPLHLLTGGPRDWPERHQTLRDAIRWSYTLLAPAEQRLFRALAIFSGGCTVEAAEAVSGESWDVIASLAEKSLIRIESTPSGEPRLRLLDMVRQYALEQTEASGEGHTTGLRHTAYFVQLAELAEPELVGPEQEQWLDRLELEHANIRTAARRAANQGDAETVLRLGAALWRFWWARADAADAHERVQSILSLAASMPPSTARAKALHGAGVLARELGDYPHAQALLEESLAVARDLGDMSGVAPALHDLGWLAVLRLDVEGGRPLLAESLEVARSVGDRRDTAMALHGLGYVEFLARDMERARMLYQESLAMAREAGDPRVIADILFSTGLSYHYDHEPQPALAVRFYAESSSVYRRLGDRHALSMVQNIHGHAAATLGDAVTASALYRESLRSARGAGNRRRVFFTLSAVAGLAAVYGDAEWSIRLDAAAASIGDAVGATVPRPWRVLLDADLATARASLGASRVAAAQALGRVMPVDQAVDEALAWLDSIHEAASAHADHDLPQVQAGAAGPTGQQTAETESETPAVGAAPAAAGLTPRELEVVRLLGRGMSNRQIAEAMVITPGTAGNYVSRVMERLGFQSRAQVAAWAVEQGLARAPRRDNDASD